MKLNIHQQQHLSDEQWLYRHSRVFFWEFCRSHVRTAPLGRIREMKGEKWIPTSKYQYSHVCPLNVSFVLSHMQKKRETPSHCSNSLPWCITASSTSELSPAQLEMGHLLSTDWTPAVWFPASDGGAWLSRAPLPLGVASVPSGHQSWQTSERRRLAGSAANKADARYRGWSELSGCRGEKPLLQPVITSNWKPKVYFKSFHREQVVKGASG